MATAHQIRELITETTTGTVRPRVPREVRDEVCRYAIRRREKGTPWAVIAGFTPHDLRRSNISDLLDEGVDLAVIARQVGHSSVPTTARYDRRGARAQRLAAERLKVPFPK